MDYQLAISPDLKIGAEEFVSAWNQSPESRSIAQADISEVSNAKGFTIIDPELLRQGVVFLAGIGSTIALDALKDIIKDQVRKLLEGKAGVKEAIPNVEVIIIQTGDIPLVVIK